MWKWFVFGCLRVRYQGRRVLGHRFLIRRNCLIWKDSHGFERTVTTDYHCDEHDKALLDYEFIYATPKTAG